MPLQRTNIGNAQMKRRSLDDRTLKRHKCRAPSPTLSIVLRAIRADSRIVAADVRRLILSKTQDQSLLTSAPAILESGVAHESRFNDSPQLTPPPGIPHKTGMS